MLLAVMVAASVTDVRRHRIPNALTYPGAVAGLLLAFGCDTGLALVGPWDAAVGWAVCTAAMVVLFVAFPIGGGDVKLLALVGPYLGAGRGIEVILWTFVIASAAGIVRLIWHFGAFGLVARTLRLAAVALRIGRQARPQSDLKEQLTVKLYLAPACLLGTLAVVVPLWW